MNRTASAPIPANVYRFDFAAGRMVPLVTADRIPLYAVLTYENRACSRKRYLVTSETAESYGQPVLCEDGHKSTCAASSVGNGQWRDTGERLTLVQAAEFIAAAKSEGERLAAENAAEKERQAAADIAQRADILARYPYLEQAAASKKSSHALAAANIRRELARAFLGVKFSVTSKSFSMGDSVDISWTDGPNREAVEAITGKYQEGSFNGMEDIYEYSSSVWHGVFGGAKYVSEQRNISPAAMLAVAAEWGYSAEMVDTERMEIKNDKGPGTHEISDCWRRECYERDYLAKPLANGPTKPVDAPEALAPCSDTPAPAPAGKTVCVEWSYPTSVNAVRFGFRHTGCWTVATHEQDQPPVALSGYADRADALTAARSTGLPWWPLMLQFHPELA